MQIRSASREGPAWSCLSGAAGRTLLSSAAVSGRLPQSLVHSRGGEFHGGAWPMPSVYPHHCDLTRERWLWAPRYSKGGGDRCLPLSVSSSCHCTWPGGRCDLFAAVSERKNICLGIPFSVQTAMGSLFYNEEVKTRKAKTFKLQDFHFLFLKQFCLLILVLGS